MEPFPMNNKAKLKNHEKEIERLKQSSSGSREFTVWRRETEETLKNLFGEDAAEVQEFNTIYYSPVFLTCRMGDEAFEEAYRNGLEEARGFLLSLMEKVRRAG
jgi:sigma54-dependent transcription regulator